MKIAIVSFGHTCATLPLAKAFCDAGHCVDFYLMRDHRPMTLDAVEVKKNQWLFGSRKITKKNVPELMEYINNARFSLYFEAHVNILYHIPILKILCKNEYCFNSFLKKVNNEKYDYVNVVTRYNCNGVAKLIGGINTKVSVTLHEVCNHSNPDFSKSSPLLSFLFKKKIDIVVPSNNSYEDIIKYRECNKTYVTVIPFGTFDTFENLATENIAILPKKYMLFIGMIAKYKGLGLLYDAINMIELGDYKVVVAGYGGDPVISKITKDERFIYLPGYVSNTVYATLIKNCSFIVCPYLTMSQSGVPQSAFVFNKAIIASDLDGFKEVIIDGYTGFLFPRGDVNQLSEIIEHLISNNGMLENISKNINNHKHNSERLVWSSIQKRYLEL